MRRITIGRYTKNDIVIDDPLVSRCDLAIIVDDDGNVYAEDLKSQNGVYVNEKRIYGIVKLNSDDVVRMGNTTLQWQKYIKELESMKVITIGRDTTNDVVISDVKVSRAHCQIVRNNEGVCSIVDLGSSNGTYVNGKRINSETQLQLHDIVRIGDTNLQWQNYIKITTKPMSEPIMIQNSVNNKKRIWYAIAGVVLTILTGAGIWLCYYSNKNKELHTEISQQIQLQDAELTARRLQAEADKLRKQFLESKNEEAKALYEKAQHEADSARLSYNKLIGDLKADISNLQTENGQLNADNIKLNKEISVTTATISDLKEDNSKLTAQNIQKDATIATITTEKTLIKEFYSITLDEIVAHDVYQQLQGSFSTIEATGKDFVNQAFDNADNKGKQMIIDIIKCTVEFNEVWKNLSNAAAKKVIAQMLWQKPENISAKECIKSQFLISKDASTKDEIIKVIQQIGTNSHKDDVPQTNNTDSNTDKQEEVNE